MTTIHHILHNIENDWGLLILFGVVMLHINAFAMVGIFHPEQIRRTKTDTMRKQIELAEDLSIVTF